VRPLRTTFCDGHASLTYMTAMDAGPRDSSSQRQAPSVPLEQGRPRMIGSEQFVWDLYRTHYEPLGRMVRLLLGGSDGADDVVQDAFIRLLGARDRLRDPELAASYLRTTAVNLTRGLVRRQIVARRHAPKPPPDPAGPEDQAIVGVRRSEVVRALGLLARRERETLVLRYYADLSEAQTAETLGISVGSVKGYTSRGLAALGRILREHT
jgi:RNA polymerase sigma-70 factor (sigma-E family)